jgi:hypothetical protein
MESTAFFEKKINLTPSELNQVKNTSIDSLLELKAKELIEKKCSEQGYVVSGSVKLISRSMGYAEAGRFTGDIVYYVKLEGKIIYPADGIRVVGEVIRKNKMGLYVEYKNAIRIQVPRDLHIGSEEYEEVQVGDNVEIELKRSKFQINDPFILASGLFITNKSYDKPNTIQPTTIDNSETKIEAKEGEEQLPEEIEVKEEGSEEEEEEGEEEEEEEEEGEEEGEEE